MARGRRLLGQLVLVLAVMAAAFVGAKLGLLGTREAGASHNFSDVPDSAFYHDFVQFLVDDGITSGCGAPPLFCGEAPGHPRPDGGVSPAAGRADLPETGGERCHLRGVQHPHSLGGRRDRRPRQRAGEPHRRVQRGRPADDFGQARTTSSSGGFTPTRPMAGSWPAEQHGVRARRQRQRRHRHNVRAAALPGASVSGGGFNTASGCAASVSGGSTRSAAGDSDWVAGSLFQDMLTLGEPARTSAPRRTEERHDSAQDGTAVGPRDAGGRGAARDGGSGVGPGMPAQPAEGAPTRRRPGSGNGSGVRAGPQPVRCRSPRCGECGPLGVRAATQRCARDTCSLHVPLQPSLRSRSSPASRWRRCDQSTGGAVSGTAPPLPPRFRVFPSRANGDHGGAPTSRG